VVPEIRYDQDQEFSQRDYFRLKVRGARAKCERLEEGEARLHREDEELPSVKNLDGVRLEIIRRDEDGDEDFSVFLDVDPDFDLPDPRGRLLRVDRADAVVLGLFAKGLPLGAEHPIRLGPIHATANFDGKQMLLSDYLESYRTGEGRYQPFFIQRKDQSFVTAPEDGRLLTLTAGDRLVAGNCVYSFELR